MKNLVRVIIYMCLSTFLFARCDNEKMEGIPEHPVEITFAGNENVFAQTRSYYPIGQDGNGPLYGTIYIRQIEAKQIDTNGKVTEGTISWGHYKVASGTGDQLETTGDMEPLKWNSSQTSYFFQALSVPINANGDPAGVEFTHKDPNNEIGNGKVTFGGYKTGLEYFVGATVGPQQLSPHGPKVVITLQRQVAKVIFGGIHHIDINGKKEEYIKDSCDIIFPNLPANATFDMGHFREQQKEYDGVLKDNHDWITLNYEDSQKGIVVKNWYKKTGSIQIAEDILQAIYVPPFIFWDNTENNRPENQSGFFVIKRKSANGIKTYTGNINNNNNRIQLFAGESIRLNVTLKDGPATGGGDGSIITEWSTAGEADVPHHPIPGIYTKEEAEKLLEALQSKTPNKIPIPEAFYKMEDGKKVIRLFINIDWSNLTETLTLPDNIVLDGQGYNVKLGANGSIEGNLKDIYISGKSISDI